MESKTLKILFASSEVYPFSKTGGLADVSAGLPLALQQLGHDVKIITPAYKSTLKKLEYMGVKLEQKEYSNFTLLSSVIPQSNLTIYFLDVPELYYRNGSPYGTELGIDWPDNAERFSTFADIAIDMAMDTLGLAWKPDVLHCNDWQTGLIPAKLQQYADRPATLFTIHNMAYLGLFSRSIFNHLNLPEEWWDWNHLEFHGQFSFLKAGILYADQVNTVSRTYAEQICTHEYAYGMEGLLNHRSDRLSGILNGIDYQEWNPELDPLIAENFNVDSLSSKYGNKKALQASSNLPITEEIPLIGMIGRMVEQKGYDLVEKIIPQLMNHRVQIVILGSGDKNLEQRFLGLENQFPDRLSVTIGYDETLAHQIEAGSDMFLMPSRFEPCGLNQLYSLRYGTVPIVNNTGGLADSVVDTNDESIKNKTATGFKFYHPHANQLLSSVVKALNTYENPNIWRQIQENGMRTDNSWSHSAQNYLSTYRKAIECQGDTNTK